MAILKEFATPQGVTATYHRLVKVEISVATGMLEMVTAMYPTAEAAASGVQPVWHEYVRVPLADFVDDPRRLFYRLLTDAGTSYLAGGAADEVVNLAWAFSVVNAAPEVETPGVLQLAKAARLKTIKQWRDECEYSKFKYDGAEFDASTASQARIQGAFQLAELALATSSTFAVDWTLADDSVRSLSAQDLVGLGRALAEHVIAAHYTARALKQQVADAATVAEVDAVIWPQQEAAP